MANLTTQILRRSGLAPTYAACTSGGDTFTPDKYTFLHIKNGSGGSLEVNVETPGTVLGDIALFPAVAVVAAGTERMMGPFPYEAFADQSDGLADISYTGVTSLTIAAIQIKQP